MAQFTTILKYDGKVAAYSVILNHDKSCSANLMGSQSQQQDEFPKQINFSNDHRNVDHLSFIERKLFQLIKRTGEDYGLYSI